MNCLRNYEYPIKIKSSEEEVLKVLSNPIGLKIFKIIGSATLTDSSVKMTSRFFLTSRVTRKQFYSNMFKLVNKTGLISRKNGLLYSI